MKTNKIISGKTILLNTLTNTTFIADDLDEKVQTGTRENDSHIEWTGELDVSIKKGIIDDLVASLKNDPDLYRAYKDNIAMAFKDNINWYKKDTGKETLNADDYHIIANKAADYFLTLLIK